MTDTFFKIHDDYIEVIFTDEMTDEDLHALHQKAYETANNWLAIGKPLLILVDLSKDTRFHPSQLKEKLHLLDAVELTAVAIYGQSDGPIHNLVVSVISSFKPVMPIKFHSKREEAIAWLHSDYNN